MPLTNIYVTTFWAAVFLFGMMGVGYLSFRFVEEPFLRFRKRYTLEPRIRDVLATTPSPSELTQR